jgi:hypothetical protein
MNKFMSARERVFARAKPMSDPRTQSCAVAPCTDIQGKANTSDMAWGTLANSDVAVDSRLSFIGASTCPAVTELHSMLSVCIELILESAMNRALMRQEGN